MAGFTGFTPKEKKQHYTDVANGTKPPKGNSTVSAQSQIDYARGQRDARNEMAINYLLGKNSPLSAEEKGALKGKLRAKNQEFKKTLAEKKDSGKKKK